VEEDDTVSEEKDTFALSTPRGRLESISVVSFAPVSQGSTLIEIANPLRDPGSSPNSTPKEKTTIKTSPQLRSSLSANSKIDKTVSELVVVNEPVWNEEIITRRREGLVFDRFSGIEYHDTFC